MNRGFMHLSPALPILLLAACVSLPQGGSITEPVSLAFTRVNVVAVESGRVLPEQTVLIAGNRIAAVGPSARMRIPPGTQVVGAQGRYLIPGLWDMHVHSSSDRITRATMLPMYVANGVTGVRDMHADCFEPCAADRSTIAQVNGWRRDIAARRLTGPRIVAASTALNGAPPGAPSTVHTPASEDDGRAVVRLLRQRGVDFIKTYDLLPREAYYGLADEAKRQGMQFAGHVPVEVRASEAADAGQRSMEHLVGVLEMCSEREDELRPQFIAQLGSEAPRILSSVLLMADSFSEERCAALYSTFVANGTWHVPTLLVHDKAARMRWRDDPRLSYVTLAERAVWEEIQKYEVETLWGADPGGFARLQRVMSDIVFAMHQAGVRILAGSDAAYVGAFPGFSLHDELELLVAAGLRPAEALRAATMGPAEYLEATDSLGTVAPGKLADLVLLDANPLEDIRNTQRISGVVANGRYFDREALDRLLADVETAAAPASDTVHVAPPTGERDRDRASVLTALEQVQPGGTVQFAPGTYLIGGEIIRISPPRLTLLGHPEGTTLRGCGPEEMARERGAIALGERCNLLELAGARQTVSNLTFEHAFWALHVGCCWEGFPYMERGEGGHLIEGNTFRTTSNAVRVHGSWTEPSIIRGNRFRNNWHSVAIYGNTVHLLDNDISALEPEEVPGFGFPWDAVGIGPSMPIKGSAEDTPGSCANNVVAGNRIEGNADGIMIDTGRPGDSCRNNVVRDNTIIVSRVRAPARLVEEWGLSEPTFIGTPIALLNYAEAFRRAGFTWTGRDWSRPAGSGGNAEAVEESFLEGNVIEGNRIVGAEGLGMEILYASGNRIANNTFTTIAPRDPFPGNFFGPRPEMGVPLEWEGANGSGIWVSSGSEENEIVGNRFSDIASDAIVLQADRNRVETRSASDPVRDLGSGNQVTGLSGANAPTKMAPESQRIEAEDTLHYTIVVGGHRKGERRVWRAGPNTWHYEHVGRAYDSYHAPGNERLVLSDDGRPVRLETSLLDVGDPGTTWEERFELRDGRASWSMFEQSASDSRLVEQGENHVTGAAYYDAALRIHDAGVLARALLRQPDGTGSLIPDAADVVHLEFWGGLVEFERGHGAGIETLVYVPPLRMPAAYRQPLRYGRIR
jgi:parallel beta-helix repeat protein